MFDANSYRITVQRRETEDGILFEGTVHEFPDVATYGDSHSDAYELVVDAIESLHKLASMQGRSFPLPSQRESEYSGKFVVRMPKWLHRDLSVEAAEQGVSLNSYTLSVLSAHESVHAKYDSTVAHVEIIPDDRISYVSSGSTTDIFNLANISHDISGGMILSDLGEADWIITELDESTPIRRLANEA